MSAIIKTISDLRESAGLSGVDVANVTQASKATVSRWNTGQSSPQPRAQRILSDLHFVASRLRDFYEPDEVRLWLNNRNEQLGGETAMELIHDNRVEEVLAAVEQMEALVYL